LFGSEASVEFVDHLGFLWQAIQQISRIVAMKKFSKIPEK
jgi:hypothetical protein